ncbi:hypothetical protein HT031_005919 [Scenedesmus sp. PABB004]|nr:hypothetical protein HT031_005919 [Scenedesmus sp. PABB004]
MARFQLVAGLLAALALSAALGAELCPERSSYNGCRKRGCISLPTTRRSPTIVCDDCGTGYQLTSQGTSRAKCECAPGYAGKGNDGLCLKCSADTDIAPGGSVLSSECLKCPAGTQPSRDRSACTCPAGHYQVSVRAEAGFVGVACKMCSSRTAYITGAFHTSRSCSTCASGKVANKDHTWCVDPKDPDAVPDTPLPGLNLTLSDIQDALSRARARAEEVDISRTESLLERITPSFGGGSRGADAAPGAVGPAPVFAVVTPELQALQKLKVGAALQGLPRAEVAELGKLNLTEQVEKLNLTSRLASAGLELADVEAAMAALNLTSLAEVPRVNVTALPGAAPGGAGAPAGSALERVAAGLATLLPNLPDPLYVAGLRGLNPEVMEEAGLPSASTVPELFGKLMRTTIGDLDTSDWLSR